MTSVNLTGSLSGATRPVRPKRWKQYLVTVSAVYPLTLLIPRVLGALSQYLPLLKEQAIRGVLTPMLLVGA
jgi:antibiotic biosynthesis monooxygenase (ABM) superfamily enzyme